MADPERIEVLFDGEPIGAIAIMEKRARAVAGRFEPGGAFERHRGLFDAAIEWARRVDGSHNGGPLDYEAFERWADAIRVITPRLSMPAVSGVIEEFALDQDLGVEVVFAKGEAWLWD